MERYIINIFFFYVKVKSIKKRENIYKEVTSQRRLRPSINLDPEAIKPEIIIDRYPCGINPGLRKLHTCFPEPLQTKKRTKVVNIVTEQLRTMAALMSILL